MTAPVAMSELVELAAQPAETMLYCRLLAIVELSQAHLDGGDLDSARDVFGQAQVLVDAESFGPDADGWVARLGTQLALANGAVEDAKGWAERIHDRFWYPISQAASTSPSLTAPALSASWTLPCRAASATTWCSDWYAPWPSRSPKAKAASAMTAAQLAASNGLLQTVAAEGPHVSALVAQAAWSLAAGWLDRLRRAATQQRRAVAADTESVYESLTKRERDVLRFLASRLTIPEIADELSMSPNTLKFHLKVIYRKLGVTSHAEASTRATDDEHPHRHTRFVGRRRQQAAPSRPGRDARQTHRHPRCSRPVSADETRGEAPRRCGACCKAWFATGNPMLFAVRRTPPYKPGGMAGRLREPRGPGQARGRPVRRSLVADTLTACSPWSCSPTASERGTPRDPERRQSARDPRHRGCGRSSREAAPLRLRRKSPRGRGRAAPRRLIHAVPI